MHRIRKHAPKSSDITQSTVQKDLKGKILRERHAKPFLKWAGGKRMEQEIGEIRITKCEHEWKLILILR